jgi:hypothetical protein
MGEERLHHGDHPVHTPTVVPRTAGHGARGVFIKVFSVIPVSSVVKIIGKPAKLDSSEQSDEDTSAGRRGQSLASSLFKTERLESTALAMTLAMV